MGLNIGGTGSGKPYCKYNAKTDKWIARAADGRELEIPRPTFAIDFDNIATGWLRFREGEAPERVMDTTLALRAPLPGDGFKRGFVVMVFSPKYFGGAAEFSGTSMHLSNAVKDLYAKYVADRRANLGKLPVVICTGSQAMESRHGINYRPTLAIAQWVARPAEFPNTSPIDATDIWQGNRSTLTSADAPARLTQKAAPQPITNPPSEAEF
jgi:hypothetical protein